MGLIPNPVLPIFRAFYMSGAIVFNGALTVKAFNGF
jgi:hypothetical protein